MVEVASTNHLKPEGNWCWIHRETRAALPLWGLLCPPFRGATLPRGRRLWSYSAWCDFGPCNEQCCLFVPFWPMILFLFELSFLDSKYFLDAGTYSTHSPFSQASPPPNDRISLKSLLSRARITLRTYRLRGAGSSPEASVTQVIRFSGSIGPHDGGVIPSCLYTTG